MFCYGVLGVVLGIISGYSLQRGRVFSCPMYMILNLVLSFCDLGWVSN